MRALAALAARRREFQDRHAAGVPPELAEAHRQRGTVHEVHGLQHEIARHAEPRFLKRVRRAGVVPEL